MTEPNRPTCEFCGGHSFSIILPANVTVTLDFEFDKGRLVAVGGSDPIEVILDSESQPDMDCLDCGHEVYIEDVVTKAIEEARNKLYRR